MRIAIFLVNRCFGSGIHSIVDAIIAANYAMVKSGNTAMFEWDLVGLSTEAVTPTNGISIQPDYDLQTYLMLPEKPDIWIFPAIFQSFSNIDKVRKTIELIKPMIPVIRQHYDKGGIIVSICSGSFLLAEAGMLEHHAALMHWKAEPIFRQLYPRIKIDTRNTIADYGNIITTIGGGLAYDYLIMHLVERFAGRHIAVDTAKLLMLSLNPPSPSPFRNDIENNTHSDELVNRAQRHIEENSNNEIQFSVLAKTLNISERQLTRRFKQTLQCTPLQYLQKVRIHKACNLLELSELPSSKIVYQVGYQDESSFRRLFKKTLGTTMEQYRLQFGAEAF
jgi:transcriptional regulator GlxA family with amidase domain